MCFFFFIFAYFKFGECLNIKNVQNLKMFNVLEKCSNWKYVHIQKPFKFWKKWFEIFKMYIPKSVQNFNIFFFWKFQFFKKWKSFGL
jgi:hypothetical protein